ncbi:hypothetical protein HYS48_03205, partial [Candidatus Woesearchaeota archaeon]|nr:hypothetical protein [Candidatus Woesearchaeota archaeon]
FETTKEKKYLEYAKKLADVLIQNFLDKKELGFFDRMPMPEDIGLLKQREKPFMENWIVAENFIQLSKTTKKSEYDVIAKKTLELFAQAYAEFWIYATQYGRILKMIFG